MTRIALLAGGLVLVAGLTGCSGDSEGSGTSTADFCDAYNDLFDRVLGADPTDSAATVRAFKQWAADMADVDAPADMPDDARHGYELFVQQAQDIDEDASLDDLAALGEGLSDADRADGEAFNSWTTDNCPVDLPSPSLSPSGS